MNLRQIYKIVLFSPNVFYINHLKQSKRFASSLNIKYLRPSNMDAYVKSRDNPIIKTLESKEFKSIFNEELVTLKSIFDKYSHELRIAGGPVRDLLMGIQPKDIDLATTATPTEMKDMFEKESIRMLNMAGEKHGTITSRINDKENFEITTLRIDIATDGRRAEVEYTKDWKLDANRRDLTINSMFLDFDGNVYDYFYGYDDLLARRILFVGTPESRIIEDYLRILRYFRFYGRIAKDANSHDEPTLKAIGNNLTGLERVSGERIWQELKKILEGNFAGDIMSTMLELGIGKYIGFPEKLNLDELRRVWTDCRDLNLHPVTLLITSLTSMEDVLMMNTRLKMSCFDRDLAFFIMEHRDEKYSSIADYQKIYLNTKLTLKVQKQYIEELLKYNNLRTTLKEFQNWNPPYFPINGNTLTDTGIKDKRQYANILKGLRDMWVDSDFSLSKEDLLELVPKIEAQIPPTRSKSPIKKKHKNAY